MPLHACTLTDIDRYVNAGAKVGHGSGGMTLLRAA